MKISNPLSYIFLFFVGLTIVIIAEVFLFKISPNSITFNNVETPIIFNLLITLWFIAWLLESFLEIFQKIFQIDPDKKDNSNEPSPKIEKFTAIIGFLVGLIIAWSGVHTIGIFFSLGEHSTDIEKALFSSVDAILTASVIAGGSKGIHELTNAYKGIMQAIKNQATNNQSPPQLVK